MKRPELVWGFRCQADFIEGKVWEPIELIDAELDVVAGGQAIIPFKQHKDGPTQIRTGTPISLEFIAAALLFLPTINS
jgi:hypothetical protein